MPQELVDTWIIAASGFVSLTFLIPDAESFFMDNESCRISLVRVGKDCRLPASAMQSSSMGTSSAASTSKQLLLIQLCVSSCTAAPRPPVCVGYLG